MAGRFTLFDTPLEGVRLIQRHAMEDQRGLFERMFCDEELKACGLERPIVQINHSITRHRGTVRGMHFQYPPAAETKIVSCLRGRVWDVALDLRRDSPTFLRWHAEELSAENRRTLYIPEGFAHGFQALSEECELLYFHTAHYASEHEGALNVADPTLAIDWPLPIVGLSERDRGHPFVGDDFTGVTL